MLSIHFATALFMAGLCVCSAVAQTAPGDAATTDGILPTGLGDAVDREIARVRAATASFKSIDAAAAAGYQREVSQCIENPPQGGMGFHHENAALLDTTLEVERPEMLVYERLPSGEYRLNGVEYIVPISAWTRDEPPTIMGQPLKKAPRLGIWYLHVWNWKRNPTGVFADWNPSVKC
jgi:hypothetical protein